MHHWNRIIAAGLLTLTGAAAAHAEQPYLEDVLIDDDRPNTARVIVHAARHPEVAVSRSLAAQPVHPWMTEVLLNESISTWIDPLAELDGEYGLPEGHTLLRAQQVARELNVRPLATPSASVGNTARVIRSPRREPLPMPSMIIDMRPAPANGRPAPAPIPSAPKPAPAPDRLMASAQ